MQSVETSRPDRTAYRPYHLHLHLHLAKHNAIQRVRRVDRHFLGMNHTTVAAVDTLPLRLAHCIVRLQVGRLQPVTPVNISR